MVAFSHTDTITADVAGRVAWRLAAAREYGDAEWFIPRASPAFNRAYISEAGGSLARAYHPAGGDWLGIVDAIDWDAAGATVRAKHIASIMEHLTVGVLGAGAGGKVATRSGDRAEVDAASINLRGVSAATVAALACRHALAGSIGALMRPGRFTEAGPLLPGYEFSRQTLADVLNDLMDRTGQEWSLDDTGALNWGPAGGGVVAEALSTFGQLVDWQRVTDRGDWPTEVIARGPTGAEQSARHVDGSFWPSQRLVQVDTDDAGRLGLTARATLDRARAVSLRYTCRAQWLTVSGGMRIVSVRGPGWGRFRWGTDPWGSGVVPTETVSLNAMRLGDWFAVLSSGADLDPRIVPARLVGITVESASDWATLDFIGAAEAGDPSRSYLDLGGAAIPTIDKTLAATVRAARRLVGAA